MHAIFYKPSLFDLLAHDKRPPYSRKEPFSLTIWSYEADGTLYEYNVKDPVFNYEDNVFTYTPEFVAESQWAGTLASVYETTVFDKAVGWSRWIRLNRQEPSLWSKSGFDDELDDDDL